MEENLKKVIFLQANTLLYLLNDNDVNADLVYYVIESISSNKQCDNEGYIQYIKELNGVDSNAMD